MTQMKEQIKTPGKELNEMEISNLSDAEINTVYKDAQGTQWGPQQHKKDPVRNEGYTIWNKEQFTGNSRVVEAENKINNLEHKEAKNNHTEQEEKRIQKMRIV